MSEIDVLGEGSATSFTELLAVCVINQLNEAESTNERMNEPKWIRCAFYNTFIRSYMPWLLEAWGKMFCLMEESLSFVASCVMVGGCGSGIMRYACCELKKWHLKKKNLRVYLVQVYPPCLELQKKCFLFSFTAATAGNAFCFAW